MKNAKKYSYLVTGGAGFIGSTLAATLTNLGHRVRVLDNFSGGRTNAIDSAEILEGDIRDFKKCSDACKDIDFVIHLAALVSVPESVTNPRLCHEVNVTGTLNMLLAAKEAGARRFVLASSCAVYGDSPEFPKREDMLPNPKSPYAASKLAGEYYCSIFNANYGLPTVALRYFNVFGPRQNPKSDYAAAVPKFITAFLKNESPTIFGTGHQTRDFVFVGDVVSANIKACERGQEALGKVVNIGSGKRSSIEDLAKEIKNRTQSSAEIRYAPERAGDVKDSLADITLAKRYLEIEAPTSLEKGLEETIAWYKTQR